MNKSHKILMPVLLASIVGFASTSHAQIKKQNQTPQRVSKPADLSTQKQRQSNELQSVEQSPGSTEEVPINSFGSPTEFQPKPQQAKPQRAPTKGKVPVRGFGSPTEFQPAPQKAQPRGAGQPNSADTPPESP